MKFIGEQFKEKREEIGISISEVSNDLKIDSIILENLEEGNDKVFKDILELKDMVLLYAKYLDLDLEKIEDDLNDFLFEKTSKISTDDIKDAMTNKEVKEEKKVKTPYTNDLKEKTTNYTFFIICIVLALILVLFYFILKKNFIG